MVVSAVAKNLSVFWIIFPSPLVFFLGLSNIKPPLEQVFLKAKLCTVKQGKFGQGAKFGQNWMLS
jgi:hypothetical protein